MWPTAPPRANSAIIHAGYDPEPGTLMARLNAEGNRMAGEICERLGVPFARVGSLVLAFSEAECKTLETLLHRGQANGVPGLRILSGADARAMEPNLSENVLAALHAPSAGIVNPWGIRPCHGRDGGGKRRAALPAKPCHRHLQNRGRLSRADAARRI